jgi:hypothetical protein
LTLSPPQRNLIRRNATTPECRYAILFLEPYPYSGAIFLQIQSKPSDGDKITRRLTLPPPHRNLIRGNATTPECRYAVLFLEPYPCSGAFFLQIQSKESNENIIARRLDTFSAGMKPHQKKCNHFQSQNENHSAHQISSPREKKKRIAITEHELKLDHVPAEWGGEESMRHE